MLSTVEVLLYSFVVFLLPLAVHSLIAPRLPFEGTPLGRLYRTDPRLLTIGNIFLLTLCFTAMGRLGIHFGLIGPDLQSSVETATQVPFMVMMVVFLGFLVRAALRLRRGAGSSA